MRNEEEFVNPAESDVAKRISVVRRLRSSIRTALAQLHVARRNMSLDTRASLRKRRAEIAASVGNIRYERRLMVNRLARNSGGPKSDLVPQELPDQINTAPTGEIVHDTMEQTVLCTIRAHPEGLTMPEIGNAVGVDWRSLLHATNSLAEAGMVERIEELIYPVRK